MNTTEILIQATFEFVDFVRKDQEWVDTLQDQLEGKMRADITEFYAVRQQLYDAVDQYRAKIREL